MPVPTTATRPVRIRRPFRRLPTPLTPPPPRLAVSRRSADTPAAHPPAPTRPCPSRLPLPLPRSSNRACRLIPAPLPPPQLSSSSSWPTVPVLPVCTTTINSTRTSRTRCTNCSTCSAITATTRLPPCTQLPRPWELAPGTSSKWHCKWQMPPCSIRPRACFLPTWDWQLRPCITKRRSKCKDNTIRVAAAAAEEEVAAMEEVAAVLPPEAAISTAAVTSLSTAAAVVTSHSSNSISSELPTRLPSTRLRIKLRQLPTRATMACKLRQLSTSPTAAAAAVTEGTTPVPPWPNCNSLPTDWKPRQLRQRRLLLQQFHPDLTRPLPEATSSQPPPVPVLAVEAAIEAARITAAIQAAVAAVIPLTPNITTDLICCLRVTPLHRHTHPMPTMLRVQQPPRLPAFGLPRGILPRPPQPNSTRQTLILCNSITSTATCSTIPPASTIT